VSLSFTIITALGLLDGALSYVLAGCDVEQPSLELLAHQAVCKNRAVSLAALTQLRAKGPEGLDVLFSVHGATIEKHRNGNTAPIAEEDQSQWDELKTALDAVSGQHDCFASHLYWYTNLEEATAAAKASGKPILSLRLLGNLDEECSCANSRFFRTTLYPNLEVSKYLREHFILHWQSVRPVPKITIDFGDGRKIQRTITGNSVHYVLDRSGDPIDVLPGLYGPKAFLRALEQAEPAALACAGSTREEKNAYLRQYHRWCRLALSKQWEDDLARIGQTPQQFAGPALMTTKAAVPTAQMAGRLAFSKSAVEAPLLKSLQPSRNAAPERGGAEVTDEMWARIALLHSSDAELDGSAQNLIVSKNPTAFQASQLAISKRLVENPFLRTWRNLQRSISEDTVRNEYQLHAQIHDWFMEGIAPAELNGLNAKVYAELFLMPESDPWLGLAPADTFSGLQNNGLVQARP